MTDKITTEVAVIASMIVSTIEERIVEKIEVKDWRFTVTLSCTAPSKKWNWEITAYNNGTERDTTRALVKIGSGKYCIDSAQAHDMAKDYIANWYLEMITTYIKENK